MKLFFKLFFVLAFVQSACSSAPTPAPTVSFDALTASAEVIALLALKDLSLRLDVPREEIKVQSIEPVTWPDSSLGCPQPGMAYAQVLTSGFRIFLVAQGQTYEYHADRNSYVIYCENPSPPVPGTPSDV